MSIALVGKYTKYEDTYTSVVKALKHASLQCRRKLILMVNKLCDMKIWFIPQILNVNHVEFFILVFIFYNVLQNFVSFFVK